MNSPVILNTINLFNFPLSFYFRLFPFIHPSLYKKYFSCLPKISSNETNWIYHFLDCIESNINTSKFLEAGYYYIKELIKRKEAKQLITLTTSNEESKYLIGHFIFKV